MVKLRDENGERVHFDTAEQYRAAVDAAEDFIIDRMGAADALEAITKALSYDTKEEIYEYIIRVYELEDPEDPEE